MVRVEGIGGFPKIPYYIPGIVPSLGAPSLPPHPFLSPHTLPLLNPGKRTDTFSTLSSAQLKKKKKTGVFKNSPLLRKKSDKCSSYK